jgi:hypothetical protein
MYFLNSSSDKVVLTAKMEFLTRSIWYGADSQTVVIAAPRTKPTTKVTNAMMITIRSSLNGFLKEL